MEEDVTNLEYECVFTSHLIPCNNEIFWFKYSNSNKRNKQKENMNSYTYWIWSPKEIDVFQLKHIIM